MKLAIYLFVWFGLLSSTVVQADGKRAFGVELDLNARNLDWNEPLQFAWPKHSYRLDPWREVAIELSSLKPVDSAQKFDGMPEIVCERLNRMIFKALGVKAVEVSKPIYALGGEKEVDAMVFSYKGSVPFEVRHSMWVWAIVIPNGNWESAKKTFLASFVERNRQEEGVLKQGAELPDNETLAQFGSKLPPFLREAIVFENKGNLVIAGSKIMGDSSIPPGHYPAANRFWLRKAIR